MKPVIAFPFRHHASLVSQEAKQMLLDAGFDIVCNDTGEKLSWEDQLKMIENAFGIVAGTEKYDAEMLSHCNNLKVIIRFGVGTDNFDLEAMKKFGIKVGVIANHNAVAEFALTLILSVMKNIPAYDDEVRKAGWRRYPMWELSGKTVGVIGMGRIGHRFCELLKGFNVRILVHDPYLTADYIESAGGVQVEFDELLMQSDIISLHIPANIETRHIINKESISKMKDGVFLINTSRGALIDETALIEALHSGKIRGAGLDVYEQEPVTPGNPLYESNNTVLAPHVSALTYETNYNAGLTCARSMINVLNGGDPVYPVR